MKGVFKYPCNECVYEAITQVNLKVKTRGCALYTVGGMVYQAFHILLELCNAS